MKMPLGTEVFLGPDDIVYKMGASPRKWACPHNFRSMCIVAKQSPISATAELLLSEYN